MSFDANVSDRQRPAPWTETKPCYGRWCIAGYAWIITFYERCAKHELIAELRRATGDRKSNASFCLRNRYRNRDRDRDRREQDKPADGNCGQPRASGRSHHLSDPDSDIDFGPDIQATWRAR